MNSSFNEANDDLPTLYQILKLHKNPYRNRYIVGSSACLIKGLSVTMTTILSAVKKRVGELKTKDGSDKNCLA